jgi:8-oxo-dGTP diphosphatase
MMFQDTGAPILAVDVALFTVRDDALLLLLARRPRPPFEDAWALPGALVRPDEPLEAAARRALVEQTGIQGVYLEQLYTFGSPGRDPRGRVVSVAHYAVVRPDELGQVEPDGVRDVRWVAAREPECPLAFDHLQIVDYALWRLASKAEYTPLLYRLLPESFTLGDLRRLWELVTNRRLDPSNFAKRVLSQGVLAPLPGAIDRRTRRPARLYRYVGPLDVPGAAERELTA